MFPHTLVMEEVLANSFKDYHVKGFDYLCLKRTPEETIKIYMFDGDVAKASEVVNPHDHRYDFETTVLAGSLVNYLFTEDDSGEEFNRFSYMTPLNGGNGFTASGSTRLRRSSASEFRRGEVCKMSAEALHTINVRSDRTVLMLKQKADRLGLDVPTFTFSQKPTPPSLTGLYSRFRADEVIERLRRLSAITGTAIRVK